MFYKLSKVTLNLLILMFLSAFMTFAVLGFVGSVVQSDLYDTKLIMERLEENGTLQTPPDDLSNEVKADIKIFGTSSDLEDYLKDQETIIANMFQRSVWMLALLVLTILARVGGARLYKS